MADEVVPTTDGGQDLGTDLKRWGNIKTLLLQLGADDKQITDIRLSSDTAGNSDTVLLTEKAINLIAECVATWGNISGTLSDQTDLQSALDLKVSTSTLATHTDDGTIHFTAASLNLSNYQLLSEKGQVSGYASLDGDGTVPASQLPSYVDDVVEFADLASFPATGETGKIYVALDTNLTYRWSGSAYVELTDTTAVWGNISGTLSNQTDLQNALDLKANASSLSSYFLLSGRSGGQIVSGGTDSGDNLTLQSTSNATKGKILFGANSAYDEVNDRLGIGQLVPTARIHGKGTTSDNTAYVLKLNDSSDTDLLSVRNDGGFAFKGGTVGLSQTGYTTFSNLTTDRTCDADSTTIDELADILGTLIEDLKVKGVIAV